MCVSVLVCVNILKSKSHIGFFLLSFSKLLVLRYPFAATERTEKTRKKNKSSPLFAILTIIIIIIINNY